MLKNYIRIGSRLVLICLGFVFTFSGVEHLWQPETFTEHYIQSGIVPSGPWVACGVAMIMLLAMMNHVWQASPDFPWTAFFIFVLTIVPVIALSKTHDGK